MAEASSVPTASSIALSGRAAAAHRLGRSRRPGAQAQHRPAARVGAPPASRPMARSPTGSLVGPGSKLLILLLNLDLDPAAAARRGRRPAPRRCSGPSAAAASPARGCTAARAAVQRGRGDAGDHRRRLLGCSSSISASRPGSASGSRPRVDESLSVAQAYLEEHSTTSSAPTRWRWRRPQPRARALPHRNPTRLRQVLTAQAALRALTEAIVFDGTGRLLARSGFSFSLEFDADLPKWRWSGARNGEVVRADQRHRRPGARAGPARRPVRRLPLRRPLRRPRVLDAPRAHAQARSTQYERARRSSARGSRSPSRDLRRRRAAAAAGRGLDRPRLRRPPGRADRPADRAPPTGCGAATSTARVSETDTGDELGIALAAPSTA